MKVVAGSASVELARELTKELATSAGAEFVEVAYQKHAGGFPDGERYVRVLGRLKGERVLVVATTYPDPKIVELLLLLDAVRDLRPKRVTLVIPYFGYGRQDKRFEPGEASALQPPQIYLAACRQRAQKEFPIRFDQDGLDHILPRDALAPSQRPGRICG